MSQLRVLVIEGRSGKGPELISLLESQGWEVHQASGGEGALAGWAGVAPNVIVLDSALDDGDAFTVASQIREKIRIPVVIHSVDVETDASRAAALDGIIVLQTQCDEEIVDFIRNVESQHPERGVSRDIYLDSGRHANLDK